jgi:hypothetical protein
MGQAHRQRVDRVLQVNCGAHFARAVEQVDRLLHQDCGLKQAGIVFTFEVVKGSFHRIIRKRYKGGDGW